MNRHLDSHCIACGALIDPNGEDRSCTPCLSAIRAVYGTAGKGKP